MEKFVLPMLILYMLCEVGCIIITNHSDIYNVIVGDDANLHWNYILEKNEKVETVFVGYLDDNGNRKVLASKGYNRSIKYRSSYNEERYKDEVTINIDNDSKVDLTLKHVQASTDDNVKYFVLLVYLDTDGDETERKLETTLIVNELPKLIGKSKSPFYVLEGTDVTLACKAEGKPSPDIKWFKGGSTDVIISGKGRLNLKLADLRRLESSNYTCIASNVAGVDSYTVSLVVQYAPKINQTLSSSRVGTYLNNPKHVYLDCIADGEPPPAYKWNNPLGYEISPDGRYALLQPQKAEIGVYRCEARNSFGHDRLTVEVYEIEKPSMVKINVTMVMRRSAVLYVDIPEHPGGGSTQAVVLSYSSEGERANKFVKELSHVPGKKKVELIHLIPYTKYELNVTVNNEYFQSNGQKKRFWTKEALPGPPSNILLFAESPNVMVVSWEQPVERNGDIIGYQLMFSQVGNEDKLNDTFSLQSTSLKFSDLEPYAEYNATVRASTNVGYGIWSASMLQRTQPEAPGIPKNITTGLTQSSDEISVSWLPPARGVAPLTQYNINITCISNVDQQIMPNNVHFGNVEEIKSVGDFDRRSVSVSKLFPYSTCSVEIREGAGSRPKWGKYSSPVQIFIPESAPGKPRNLALQSASHDHLRFIWERPDRINGVLKKYVIQYENSSGLYTTELARELKNETFYYTLDYLNQMTTYTIKIIAHTENYDSVPIVMKMHTTRMPTPALTAYVKEEGNAGPVIGGVLTVIFILVLVGGILLYIVRKKKRFNRTTSDNSDVGFFQKGQNGHLVDGPMNSPVTKSVFMMSDYVKNAQCTFSPKNPVPITSLKDLVQKYHTNKAKGFIDEFRSVKCDRVGSLEISSRAENKCKNRYANILAYDHSRVVLNTVEDLEGSDYVNANYIDGYNKKKKFIATQGPVVAAFNDFWRMIWEQDTSKIIMVTNLVEKSRIKCQKYWPCENEKGVLYGSIKVQMIDELPLAEYVVRRFSITQMRDDIEILSRTVTQYQFLSWPDHGVPQYPTALLQFVKRVRALDPGSSGPIVCHCSAGVGRTGTYMTLDAMLDQIENEKTVDVLGYVTHIRGQRQLMVQTDAQYTYIYDTLLEAVSCGNTEVNTVDLFARIKHLDSINPGTTRTYMQEEFERVSFNIDDSNQYEAALLTCNTPKNRYSQVLPYELTRVKLWPYANVEGSDYINASFVDGYQQREAYILTQSPLENTVEEFWRMLWEYEIFTIVMISSPTERSKHHCYPYWPLNSEPTLFGILAVQLAVEEEKGGFIRREFRVTNSKNGDSRTISHFMYFDWPTEGSPDTTSAIEMIGQVQKTQQQTGNSAIVVHCSDGSGRSGSLAALMYCLERLKLEGLVDVFQTVRSMRTQRTGLVQSLDQYHFIYMAVSNFLDCFSNYANFK